MSAERLEQQAWSKLETVFDPCSVATRSPLSIVDMGLVRRLTADAGGNVEVEISPTAASCILIASIAEAAEQAIRGLDGVAEVRVEIDSDFFWTPDAMTERGAALLAQHRARRTPGMLDPRGRAKAASRGAATRTGTASNG